MTLYHRKPESTERVMPVALGDAVPDSMKNASVGRRWKFRRNLVIVIAHQNGVSQRLLADVFDLPHSRIAAIVKEFREKYGRDHVRLPDDQDQ